MKTILSAVLMAAVLGLATGARGAEPAPAKPDEAKAEPAKSDAVAEPAKADAKAEPAKAESAPADAPKVAAPVQLIEGSRSPTPTRAASS